MRRQAKAGQAVLAILHDLNLAAAIADHLVLLAAGSVRSAGPPEDALRDDVLSATYGCRVAANRQADPTWGPSPLTRTPIQTRPTTTRLSNKPPVF